MDLATSAFDSSRCVSKFVLANIDCSLATNIWQCTATKQMPRSKKKSKEKQRGKWPVPAGTITTLASTNDWTDVCMGALADFAS